MPENEPIDGQEEVTIEAIPTPRIANILGYQILWDRNVSQKLSVDTDSNTVVVNPELFKNTEQAEVTAATTAMRQSEIANILRSEKTEDIKTLSETDPEVIGNIALWGAAQRLRESERQNLEQVLAGLPPADSYKREATNACFQYVATGSFPEMSSELKISFESLPASKRTGGNPLDAIADGAVSIDRKLDYYQRFITPIIQQAMELDRQLEETVGDSFKPSTEDNEGEPLNESEILQRVYPFFGGHYREKVFDGVDWESMQVVATPQTAQSVEGLEIDENEEIKQYQFKGTDGQKLADGPLIIPLPAGAEIIRGSLTPGLVIKRDPKGICLISADLRSDTEEIGQEYEFEFVVQKKAPDFMSLDPTEVEKSSVAASDLFSPETSARLDELGKTDISASAMAKRIVGQIRQDFEYVNSDEVGAMLGQAGQEYFKTLENVKKADCDVSNFYLIAQLRSLGIPARMVTGYYVTDKRFGFAPLAGTKHAWTEFFDITEGIWKRIDATPPKKDDEEEEKEKEEGGSGGGEEMREQKEDGETGYEGETEDEGLELTQDQLEKFNQFLQNKYNEILGSEDTAKQRMQEEFLKEYGISPEEWERVVKYIDEANQTKIPRENTIDKIGDSTLGDEWKKFFELFLVAYRLPDKTRIIQSRQSLGDDLVDPSSAAIDLLSGSDDPYGFEKVKRGEREIKLPIDFSNDFLLDLTASMEASDRNGHSLKEYQKTFVMSALYHGFEINQQLKYFAGELSELPFISNHLLSIHGKDKFRELTSGEREITMTQLAELYKLLDQTEQGAGDMVGALEAYRDALMSQPETVTKIMSGKMVKTLTILSDGNLWCSACGKESCNYSLHVEAAARSKAIVDDLRKVGVIVNAVGFTEKSMPVVDMFDTPESPGSAVVATDIAQAVAMHHSQMIKSWEIIKKAAEFRKLGSI
ncbi:MAG: hypothetical protein NTZ65_04665 [Candidatus Berkelbacteria bacterium]|nr:hypothetical protein [Candidatus Berkelbacteria bacterium]